MTAKFSFKEVETLAILKCAKCGASNRVDERVTVVGKQPVCGRCGARLETGGGASATGGGASATGGGASATGGASSSSSSEDRRPREVTDASFAREVVEASGARPVLLDC